MFVRSILEREMLRARLQDATARYAQFLEKSPAERDWLAEWEGADLSSPPKALVGHAPPDVMERIRAALAHYLHD